MFRIVAVLGVLALVGCMTPRAQSFYEACLDTAQITAEEIAQLKKLIAQAERESKSNRK